MGRLTTPQHSFRGREWFESLREAVVADAEMAVIGRWCDLNLALAIDGGLVLLRIRGGKLVEIAFGPYIGVSWTVTLRGTLDDWRTFLQPRPPPFQSVPCGREALHYHGIVSRHDVSGRIG